MSSPSRRSMLAIFIVYSRFFFLLTEYMRVTAEARLIQRLLDFAHLFSSGIYSGKLITKCPNAWVQKSSHLPQLSTYFLSHFSNVLKSIFSWLFFSLKRK